MTIEEFSNSFDTLLNSYRYKSEFGEQSSIGDVNLDEYEKSIFLTQAQDNIVKRYFSRTLNPSGEGFDDSTRRQLDFSSLITVKEITSIVEDAVKFNDNSVIVSFEDDSFGNVGTSNYASQPLFIINEKVTTGAIIDKEVYSRLTLSEISALEIGDSNIYTVNGVTLNIDEDTLKSIKEGDIIPYKKTIKSKGGQSFVVVPINYKDYDRMMSKAYSEPLKRQAWRLFESDSNDCKKQAEIILRSDAGDFTSYKVRYVRRPRPIVLVDLTDTDNALTIDGIQKVTPCELNPIVHSEILEEAVRLALMSKGIETREMRAAREQQNNR